MKVMLEEGVWLLGWPAVCDGDPPRTLNETDAHKFDTMDQAKQALEEARAYRPFENAVITEDFI
jgi:hypothetical protein